MFKFADADHEKKFNEYIQAYNVDPKNRDYVLLLYLLAAIDPGPHIEDMIEVRPGGGLKVKRDALRHDWLTSSDRNIIRLAFNLYNWGAPTIQNDMTSEEKINELEAYLPVNLFTGHDSRRNTAILEAIRLLMVM